MTSTLQKLKKKTYLKALNHTSNQKTEKCYSDCDSQINAMERKYQNTTDYLKQYIANHTVLEMQCRNSEATYAYKLEACDVSKVKF